MKQAEELAKRKMLAEKYKFQPGPIEETNYKVGEKLFTFST